MIDNDGSHYEEPYIVISADSHAGASLYDYKPYLEREWHDDFEAWATTYSNPWDFVDDQDPDSLIRTGAATVNSPLNWDSPRRIADLESDGIVAEVIFPNTTPPFMPGHCLAAPPPQSRVEYERRWAGLRAHNRWLADFCREAPGRRAGVAQVLLYDIDDTVAEIEATRANGLSGGILLPPDAPTVALLPLYYPKYEPIWALCEDLDLPVGRHGTLAGEPISHETGPAAGAVMLMETRFFAHRALWHLIFAGVFERHPRLRFVCTEGGASWTIQDLAELDALYRTGIGPRSVGRAILAPAMAELPLQPSDYFRRNCYLGASFLLPSEAAQRYEIGVDRIMWGGDYPHSEGTFPFSRQAFQATFGSVAESEVRFMLGLTAAEVYGFDLNVLRPFASRCGPKPSEVVAPLRNPPNVPDDTICPVFENTVAWA